MSVDFNDIRFLAGKLKDYLDYVLEPGDLLFTRYNGTRSLVGVCAVVPTIIEKFVHPDKIIRCKAVSPEASIPGYLEIVLNTGSSRGFLEKRIRTTAGQSGVSGSDLRQIPVPLPPVNEQRRIVAEVERRLSVIDELEATIATNLKRADRLRQAILKRAFEGKLVPQDPADEPASMLLERIRTERGRPTEKPQAIPRQTKTPQPAGQLKVAVPVQGELALEFRQ
jgi:type I restriction enzyme S subunit